MTTYAAHFNQSEFVSASDCNGCTFTPTMLEYAAQLSQILEVFRSALGDHPIVITSWYCEGDSGQHGEGTAVDCRVPQGVSQLQAYHTLTDLVKAGKVRVGQLIFYPFSDYHFHVSLPTGTRRNEILVESGGEYLAPSADIVATIPSDPSVGAWRSTLPTVTVTASPDEPAQSQGSPWSLSPFLAFVGAVAIGFVAVILAKETA